MKLDILVFAAHPDDAELACGGTIIKQVKQGKKVGIIDLTRGELGTRGDVKSRAEESAVSSRILGISVRENLGLPDGFLTENEETLKKIVTAIRKFQPEIILCNATADRHPDHGIAGKMVARASFLSGLIKVDTNQSAWRPKAVYHYVQDRYMQPDVVVDISEEYEERMKAVLAFKTQFYNPGMEGPVTPISTQEFLENLKGRLLQFGRLIHTNYGEGYTVERPVGTNDLTSLL